MYAALKDTIANASAPVRIGEVNQESTSESITQRGLGFIDKFAELAAADGKKVAVVGNEYYVNAAKDKEMISKMSNNAREYYLRYASPEKMAQGALDAIEYVLKNQKI